MKIDFRFLDGLFKNKFTPFVCVSFLILLTFFIRFSWIHQHQKQFEQLADHLQQYIETATIQHQQLSDDEIQPILKSNPNVAFFVYDNQLDKNQYGFINTKSFDLGANALATFYKQHSMNEVLQEIIQNPQEFSSPYLKIQERQVFQTMNDQKVKVGQMTAAYILPGYSSTFSKTGGYYDFFYKGLMIFLVSNMMMFPFFLRKKVKTEKAPTNKDHLEWLEQDLNGQGVDEDTTRDNNFPKSNWTELFNQFDLKDWNVRGEWYVKDQTAIGFPWGSSMVTRYEIPFEHYEFEVEIQRMTGSEGFVILFQSQGKQLIWVLGGWKNTRSEVTGYASTITPDTLEKFRWYYVKIESDHEKLVGFLDGRKIWEIQKKDIQVSPPDVGFQNGFGVGVWSSMARFQRIRIISTD